MFKDFFSTIPENLQDLFKNNDFLWSPLNNLSNFIKNKIQAGNLGEIKGDVFIEGDVEIGVGTVIEHGAVIIGPAIIGKNCEIRSGAYIRGNVVIGDNCVIGHSSEIVRSILLDNVRVDHFNYVGDSILGRNVHFGAGAKVANLRFDSAEIVIDNIKTGRNKFGVILGDDCQLGVNVAIGPGVILCRDTWVLGSEPLKSGIYKSKNHRILKA